MDKMNRFFSHKPSISYLTSDINFFGNASFYGSINFLNELCYLVLIIGAKIMLLKEKLNLNPIKY